MRDYFVTTADSILNHYLEVSCSCHVLGPENLSIYFEELVGFGYGVQDSFLLMHLTSLMQF